MLAAIWGLPHSLVGAVILAGLTGLTNAYTALRLLVQGREDVVVSEAINSNSINLLAGVALPAVAFGFGQLSDQALFELGWLAGMTALTLGLLAGARGLRRSGGALLVGLYLVFIGVLILRFSL